MSSESPGLRLLLAATSPDSKARFYTDPATGEVRGNSQPTEELIRAVDTVLGSVIEFPTE